MTEDVIKPVAKTATHRLHFEAWVDNPHLLNRCSKPGKYEEYEHPWTRGAWTAWQYLRSL